jgi:hypothetical protein
MITSVREGSHIGPGNVLGDLVGETATRYIYRRRDVTAFVNKRSPAIHIAQGVRGWRASHGGG